MNNADIAVAMVLGNSGSGWPRDGMVAAKNDGDNAPPSYLADLGFDVGMPNLGLVVRAICVAEIDYVEPVEDLDAQIKMIGAAFVCLSSNGSGAEARTRSVCD